MLGDCPTYLETLIGSCLDQDSKARPSSAHIQNVLEKQDVSGMPLAKAADCAEDKTLEPFGSSVSLHSTMFQRKDSSYCMESQLFQPLVSEEEEGHSNQKEQMVSTSFTTHSEVSDSEGYTVRLVAPKVEKGHSDELSSSTNDDISQGPAQPPLLPSRLKEGDGMLKATSLTAHLQSDVNVATGA